MRRRNESWIPAQLAPVDPCVDLTCMIAPRADCSEVIGTGGAVSIGRVLAEDVCTVESSPPVDP